MPSRKVSDKCWQGHFSTAKQNDLGLEVHGLTMLGMDLVGANYIWAELFKPIIKHHFDGDLMVTFWWYWVGFTMWLMDNGMVRNVIIWLSHDQTRRVFFSEGLPASTAYTWLSICSAFLVGGFNLSEKLVSWDDYLQYGGNNSHVPNHQSALNSRLFTSQRICLWQFLHTRWQKPQES